MSSMNRQVILVTGTPCVGKTTLSKQLSEDLKAFYVNLTALAEKENLIESRDKERDTAIISEAKMRRKLKQLIENSDSEIIIVDGHYAAAVTPKQLVTYIFVLRRNPHELRDFMQKRGYNSQKQAENLSAEILDVCLVEALQEFPREKICELDLTGKTLNETLTAVKDVLAGKQKCSVGKVDWLGLLVQEGTADEYLNM